MDEPAFQGFPGAMQFLADLRANNERAWFTAHKATYETAVRGPAEAFVAAVRPELEALAERPLGAKIFRIHRDVRFSKDKSPYNTHLHIGFMAGPEAGERHGSGYYFGLEPERVIVGVGCFDLEGARLDRFRAAIADGVDGGALAALLDKLMRAGCRMYDPPLKRVPAPYRADHPRGELLRHKGLAVWRDIEDRRRADGPGVLDDTMASFREMQPVNEWLAEALS
jgi:uncharacterized protein (TIGR02453 family)